MNDAVHDVDRGGDLREEMRHMDSHEKRLVGALKHQRGPIVLPCGVLGRHLRVGEELVQLADLLLSHTLQWIVHAAHNLLLLVLHHALRLLTRIYSGSRHLRCRLAHDQRLLTAHELLLILVHLLHSHRLLEANVLLWLHSVWLLHLLRVLVCARLAHDISLWRLSDRLLLSHFNIIVYYNSAKAFKKS